jgi:hypothetical protein
MKWDQARFHPIRLPVVIHLLTMGQAPVPVGAAYHPAPSRNMLGWARRPSAHRVDSAGTAAVGWDDAHEKGGTPNPRPGRTAIHTCRYVEVAKRQVEAKMPSTPIKPRGPAASPIGDQNAFQ